MHETLNESPTVTTKESDKGGTSAPRGGTTTGGSGATRQGLRGMSYEAGQTMLSPGGGDGNKPVQAYQGELGTDPTTTEGTSTTEPHSTEATTDTTSTETTASTETTDTTATTGETTGGGETPKKTEKEVVAEVHGQTIEALTQRIIDLRKEKQKVFNFRKEKRAANDAKSIFELLSQYDSQTITAAWENVKGKAQAEFDMLVDAIGYKDAARSFPREARATLMACDPTRLTAFAEDTVKKNPFACELAVSVMTDEARTAFEAAHADVKVKAKKQVTAADEEKLDAELMSLKDASLRKDEEAFRERVGEAKAEDAKKDEDAKKGAADAEPLVAKVRELATGKQYVEAMGALGAEGNEQVFVAAVRKLDDGTLSTIIRGMSFSQRWNDVPGALKRALGARDSARNLEDARVLLDVEHHKKRTVTTKKGKQKEEKRDEVSSDEAYEALHLLKALPAAHRELFQKTYPELTAVMESKLNDSMKEADDTNFFGGEGDKATVAELTLKVRGDALWLESPVGQLDMTLRMALKANLRAEIKAKLESMKGGALATVYGDGAKKAAIEGALGTIGDPSAMTLPPEMPAEEKWLASLKLSHIVNDAEKEGPGGLFGMSAGVGKGGLLRAVFHANKATRKENEAELDKWKEAKKNGEEVGEKPDLKNPSIFKQIFGAFKKDKSFEVDNLALDEVQDTTDAFSGGGDIEFAKFGERKGDNLGEDRNRADLEFDQNSGVFDFACPHLELVKLRYPLGDMLVETGPAIMKNVKLTATWPTAQKPDQVSSVKVSASSIDISHVMVTQPGMLAGLQQIVATDLAYASGEQKIDFGDNPGASQALALLKEYNPARSIISFGLASAGFMSSKRSQEQAADSIAALTNAFSGKPSGSLGGMSLSLGGMTATGVTYNAGTYVGKAEVKGLSLVWDNRPSVTGRARIDQLKKMIADAESRSAGVTGEGAADQKKRDGYAADVTKWTKEKAELEGKLGTWEALEKVYQEIYEHQKLNGPGTAENEAATKAIQQHALAAGLVGADTMTMSELAAIVQKRLNDESGVVASVGEMSVEGVDAMGTKVESAKVSGLNVAGTGDSFGEAVDPKLMKRLGSEDGKTTKQGKPIGTSGSVDIAEIDIKGVSVAGSAPKVDALTKTKAELEKLRTSVATLAARPASELGKEDKQILERDKKKLEDLEVQWKKVVGDGLTYGGVADELIQLSKDPGMEAISKSADLLGRWKALEEAIASEPLTVEEITITRVAASGKTETVEGEHGSTTTASSSLSIGEVTAKNVKSGDKSVGSASLTDIKGSAAVTTTKDDATGATSVSGSGNMSVGGVEASDVKMGDKSIKSVKGGGISASGEYTEERSKGADGKEKTERTASGTLEVGDLTGQGVNLTGTEVSSAGLSGLKVGVQSDNGQSSVDVSVSKIYATGVGLSKGIDAANAKRAMLEKQIAEAQEKKKDIGALSLELSRLDEDLAKYREAYAQQDAVMGKIATCDEKLEAATKRLEAAEREAATFDHRVVRGEEEARNEADQKRVKAVKEELVAIRSERKSLELELKGPQATIGKFESALGITGTASVENLSLHAEGLPGMDQLTSKDPDLSSKITLTLGVGPIKIPTVDYSSPTFILGLGSATVPSIQAKAGVQIKKVAAPGGGTTYGVGSVDVQDLSIPEISGNALKLTLPIEGQNLVIELPTASVRGISLKGVHLDGFDAASLEKATGQLDIKAVEASVSSKMADHFSMNGHISASDINATAVASGALDFGLKGLTLDQFDLSNSFDHTTKKGTRLIDSILKVGGKATKLGKLDVSGSYDRVNKSLSTTVDLGDLTLSGVSYVGNGTSLGVGFAQLKSASVTVGAQFKQGKVEPGESPLESLELSEVKAGYLRGSNINYVGTGMKRERFENGSVKEVPFRTGVSMKSGTLHGLTVRGIRIIGDGLTNISASLRSGTVDGLKVGMKEDGKSILQANVSASVSGVNVTLADDDLHADFSSFKGSVDATLGEGENAANIGAHGIEVKGEGKDKASVDVTNMGKRDQVLDLNMPNVEAKSINFEQGIKGSGYNKPFVLGSASLKGVKVKDTHDLLSVDVTSGTGIMGAGISVTGAYSGSTAEEKAAGGTNDQMKVPIQKVTWKNLSKSSLDGFLRLNYPDKSQLLKLKFANNGVTLDLQENIDRMWNEWYKGFERDGESWFAYLWKASKTVLSTPGNLLWHALFRGLEAGFNFAGQKLLGDWPAIEATILSTLNTNPKTSIVPGHQPAEGDKTFTAFTTSINQVIQDYVEPAIEGVCDFGLVYDVVHGDYGRAAKTTGLWLWEQVGNVIDWGGKQLGYDNVVDFDDDAQKKQDELRAQRKAELESMVKSGLDKVLGWGADIDLHTKGGVYEATKEPNPNPEKKPATRMMKTGLALDMSGGGTLKNMSLGTTIGLSGFEYTAGGTSANVDKLTMSANASGGVNHQFEDKGVRMKDASLDAGAGVVVTFEGLHFEQDKNWVPGSVGGVETTHERYKKTGQTGQGGGPVSDGDNITYDAGDYANRVNSGQGVVGPTYSEELSMGETVKKTIFEYTVDPATGLPISKIYENQVIGAKNAQVYGKYQAQYDKAQGDKKKGAVAQ